MTSKEPRPERPLVVGIGASAGGFEAFTAFFTHMPVASGMVFILVQHLSPDYHSLLADLVGRRCRCRMRPTISRSPPITST